MSARKATFNRISWDPTHGEIVVYIVDDGPWPHEAASDDVWRARLSPIQEQIYAALDAAIDGPLSERFPESLGKRVRVQIDSPSGVPSRLSHLIGCMQHMLGAESEYSRAVEDSRFIASIRVVSGHELGRFGAEP